MTRPWLMAPLVAVLATGCVRNQLAGPGAEHARVDVAIVPGCPTESDGSLSECLERRVLWAGWLWKQGAVDRFITSGGAVHNRYVEAEALAAGLTSLGVPASCIWVEPHARHTDENVYYGMHTAWRHDWPTIAVASDAGHAAAGCTFIESWGEECVIAAMQTEAVVEMREEERSRRLGEVRVPAVAAEGWLAQEPYDEQRAEVVGRSRPGSLPLYFFVAPISRLFNAPWYPLPSPQPWPQRYSAWLARGGVASAAARPDLEVCGGATGSAVPQSIAVSKSSR